jgi:Neurotransmitter-gated ion-channel ligand binding domain
MDVAIATFDAISEVNMVSEMHSDSQSPANVVAMLPGWHARHAGCINNESLLQDYTVTMYLNQYWKDERLAYTNKEETMTLSGDFAEKIWVPDTFFANDKYRLGQPHVIKKSKF